MSLCQHPHEAIRDVVAANISTRAAAQAAAQGLSQAVNQVQEATSADVAQSLAFADNLLAALDFRNATTQVLDTELTALDNIRVAVATVLNKTNPAAAAASRALLQDNGGATSTSPDPVVNMVASTVAAFRHVGRRLATNASTTTSWLDLGAYDAVVLISNSSATLTTDHGKISARLPPQV